MEQRCHLAMVWMTWLLLPLLAVLVGLRTGVRTGLAGVGVLVGLAVLAIGIVAQVLYIRWFPHISRPIGYGSVADTPAALPTSGTLPAVTLYTASLCPFCPIIRRRLAELQRQHGFEVREIDVTFRPEIVRAKGLRSVPVLEASGRLLVGNATSAQIVKFLRSAAGAGQAAD
jgi:glutaredoxin